MLKSKQWLLALSPVTLLALTPLNALNDDQAEIRKVQSYQETDVIIEEEPVPVQEDIWFGPGFYYGIWFDNEADYWGWRHEHWDYPPNHDYYNHDHPVEYHHNDGYHHDGGFNGSPRGGEDYRGGGGHGGGHGGGGGHR